MREQPNEFRKEKQQNVAYIVPGSFQLIYCEYMQHVREKQEDRS
jgi:hypothetical protein